MLTRPPLTAEFCRTVTSPASGNRVHRCGKTRGLAIQVTAKGNRSFVFCYTSPSGQERRMTIGALGAWTLPAARERVGELRRMVDSGIDPLAEKRAVRDAITLRQLWEWYSASALTKLATASQRDVAAAWKSKIEPRLGAHTKAANLTRQDVQSLVDHITATTGSYSANRCHSYLRRILNLAKADGLIPTNPAAAQIQRNAEHGRERYLSQAELKSLGEAIDTRGFHPPTLAIKLLMLTGARRSEVLKMRWDNLDLVNKVWTKPPSDTKQGKTHRVPLSQDAVAILLEIMAKGKGAAYVFAGPGKVGHLTDLKRTWSALKKQAGISECRIHDLRHTYASLIASGGGSLVLIGALLGHSQVQTTQRYAHLYDDALRSATEQVATSLGK